MSAGLSSNQFSFPILKPSEIVTCMADLQLPLTLEDLERPAPARMVAVYECFTDSLMGLGRDAFQQPLPNFAAVEMLEHPDLHQEALTLMAFYRQLSKLMIEVGVTDFSIRDVIKPEPGRVRRVLSAVINFAKFREERILVFEQCNASATEMVERKQGHLEKKRELADYVNTLRLQRAEEEPDLQRLREQNQALTAELRELKRTQTAMTAAIDGLKKGKAETAEKLTNVQFLLMNCKQDCARLRSRVVQSPEKLQQAIADMTQSVQGDKAALAAIERRARDLQVKLDLMGNIDQ
ncbi:kinetochore-associated Ndc80 complex subunit nuf2, partial [Cladochytrium tenue]